LKTVWFTLLVWMQLAFVVVLPAGLGNDETGHLIRMWALVEGHFHCDKMPQAVRDLETKNLYTFHTRGQSYREYWRHGVTMSGGAERVDGHNYECGYFPLGLTLPALVTRLVALDWHGNPRRGGVFLATYAARIISLAVVDVALWWLITLVPWAAFFALGVLTLPMGIEQSVSVGHDGLLIALCLLLLTVLFTRDDWTGVILIVLLATAMTLEKPVFAGFSLLAWPMLSRRLSGWRRVPLLAVIAGTPTLVWQIWYRAGKVKQRTWHPSFSNPDAQMKLLHKPLHALKVLAGYWHYFLDDKTLPDFMPHRINGVWTTLFFANMWVDMPMRGYLLCVAGLALALAAAATSPEFPVERPAPWWTRAAALLAVAAAIPLTIFALYVIFSPLGAPGPYGVVGRYHALPLLTLTLLALGAAKRRLRWRGSPLLAAASCALLLGACGYALSATWSYYWM
jgi:hypothetical protein